MDNQTTNMEETKLDWTVASQ